MTKEMYRSFLKITYSYDGNTNIYFVNTIHMYYTWEGLWIVGCGVVLSIKTSILH